MGNLGGFGLYGWALVGWYLVLEGFIGQGTSSPGCASQKEEVRPQIGEFAHYRLWLGLRIGLAPGGAVSPQPERLCKMSDTTVNRR